MAKDWVDSCPCLFSGKEEYVRNTKDLRDYLRAAQCHILEPHDNIEDSYGPVPSVRLQRIPNSTLATSVWSYYECGSRYVRDCSLLHRTKYLFQNVFKPTVGSCP